jgi:hypothetical protein
MTISRVVCVTIAVGHVLRHRTLGSFSSLLRTTRYLCSDRNDGAEPRKCENKLIWRRNLGKRNDHMMLYVQLILPQEDGQTIHVRSFNDIVYEQMEALEPKQWRAFFAICSVRM